MLRLSTTLRGVATKIDPDDLIGLDEVAPIIGLTNPRGVSVYRRRHADFPTPRFDKGQCVLWLRADIEKWAHERAAKTSIAPASYGASHG